MLTHIQIQRYKSLYDVHVDLEPLTVFIGPNGSGKSNICEALLVLSGAIVSNSIKIAIEQLLYPTGQDYRAKFWQGGEEDLVFTLHTQGEGQQLIFNSKGNLKNQLDGQTVSALKRVVLYNFNPAFLASATSNPINSTGYGVANSLADILFDDRNRFIELEQRFIDLVPNIARISLQRVGAENRLRLVDKYSEHIIPTNDISDGTLRILAFLTAVYQTATPDILCFEEPENGVHPWLLHKMIDLLNLIATEGMGGKPVQVLITTHSPVLLNYVKPEQIRVVELDREGKTQVYGLPKDSTRFRRAMDAYDQAMGELWFTNLFGGNPI